MPIVQPPSLTRQSPSHITTKQYSVVHATPKRTYGMSQCQPATKQNKQNKTHNTTIQMTAPTTLTKQAKQQNLWHLPMHHSSPQPTEHYSRPSHAIMSTTSLASQPKPSITTHHSLLLQSKATSIKAARTKGPQNQL